jgi:hypothetical protein
MFTKARFKHIALGTVAVMNLGVLSVAPLNAALGTSVFKTTFIATGTISGTTADPFAVDSAINVNVLIDLASAGASGETFTLT